MSKLTPILSGVLLAFAANANADTYDTMHKQLNIMSKIIKSSVGMENSQNRSRITGVESVYLKGQGVVFTINSSAYNNRWGSYNFNFTMPEIPELPAVPPVPELPKVDVDFEHEIINEHELDKRVSEAMELAAESYERAMDSLNDERESYRDLREKQRDLSYQVRELEREKRDIEYQMRRADKSSRAELAKEAEKLNAKKAEIEELRSQLTTKTAEFQKKQQQQKQQQAKERQQYYQSLTASLVESFCLYGNGLKAVPKNENISLIIKAAGEKERNRYKDTIYVFSKKDISDCAIDKINADTLLAKGQGYQF